MRAGAAASVTPWRRRLAAYGASVYLHHHVPHDAAMPWGADRIEDVTASVRQALGDPGARVVAGPGDLGDPDEPAALHARAVEALGGRLDVLVANHALSGSDGDLGTVDAAMLDAHWAVDTRSVLLLVQAHARHRATLPRAPRRTRDDDDVRQDIAGGMPDEIAYALQKGALASVTRSLATTLADHAVTVNTVNPGPVDTDYLTGEVYDAIAARFPRRALGHARRPGPPHRVAGHGRGGLDHRPGHRLRGRFPALNRRTGPTAPPVRPPGRPGPAIPGTARPCART